MFERFTEKAIKVIMLAQEEARRLAEEAKDLAAYRSEFFGTLRQLLSGREGVRLRPPARPTDLRPAPF